MKFDDGTSFWTEPGNYTFDHLAEDIDYEQQPRRQVYSKMMSKLKTKLKKPSKNKQQSQKTSKHLTKYENDQNKF
jgi:hypothetical protein